MFKRTTLRSGFVTSLLVLSLGLSACSSDDDNDDANGTVASLDESGSGDPLVGLELDPNIVNVAELLGSAQTVPPAVGADDAEGTGGISVNTETGAISGFALGSDTTSTPNMAHIHEGAPGVAGPILVTLERDEDGISENAAFFEVPESSAIDAASIQAFEDGNLYLDIHTEANPAGELRAQLVPFDSGDAAPLASGTAIVEFFNLSLSQPMTPPVVILHNAPESENGIRFFQIGDVVGEEIKIIAEDGDMVPLIENAESQILTGRVSAVAAAVPEEGELLLPGETVVVTLTPENPYEVLSIVAKVVCTNDGFIGVDSLKIADIPDGALPFAVYDAGSETNVEMLDWWVSPCGTDTNNTDDENGVIAMHPGQANAENPDFNFPGGSEPLLATEILIAE